MNSASFFSFVILASVLAACGGEQGSAPAPAPETAAGDSTPSTAPFCTNYCDWKSRCGKGTATCASSCASDSAELRPHVRKEYWSAMEQCFMSLACGTTDDACVGKFALVDSAYPDIPVVQDCLAKRTECAGTFADDFCHSLTALTDAARQAADACRSRPCSDVASCLRGAGAFSL